MFFGQTQAGLLKTNPKIVERLGFPSIVPSFFALVVAALYRTTIHAQRIEQQGFTFPTQANNNNM
jgi:hypothetical protein